MPFLASGTHAGYQTFIRCLYPGVSLRQIVLHVGEARTRFVNSLEDVGISFRYTVIDIRELDCASMLASPSEVREMPITVDVMENDFLREIFEDS